MWSGVCVHLGDLVECSVIDTEACAAVLLFNQDRRTTPSTVPLLCNPNREHVLNETQLFFPAGRWVSPDLLLHPRMVTRVDLVLYKARPSQVGCEQVAAGQQSLPQLLTLRIREMLSWTLYHPFDHVQAFFGRISGRPPCFRHALSHDNNLFLFYFHRLRPEVGQPDLGVSVHLGLPSLRAQSQGAGPGCHHHRPLCIRG